MSEQSEYSEQKSKKSKGIHKKQQQYKRKRTTTKEAQSDGKILLKCEFCPLNHQRSYQSFPALYFHVKDKHPGQNVTSSKVKESEKEKDHHQTPVLKLITILRETDIERQQTERDLINIKQLLCLKLSQKFLKKKMVQFHQIGDQLSEESIHLVYQEALKIAKTLKFNEQYFKQAEKGQIFREYFTKFGVISFGKDIVQYYAKNLLLSSKLLFEIILMEAVDSTLIDRVKFRDLQNLLWGENLALLKPLKQRWNQWKSINKQALIEDYKDVSNEKITKAS